MLKFNTFVASLNDSFSKQNRSIFLKSVDPYWWNSSQLPNANASNLMATKLDDEKLLQRFPIPNPSPDPKTVHRRASD